MKAHKYWSLGALAAMIGTFYTGYKNMKTASVILASIILCKHFFSFDYSADSLETEFFFFLDLPEIIL